MALQTFSAAVLNFSEEVQKWRFFYDTSEQIPDDAVVGFFNSIKLRLYRKPRGAWVGSRQEGDEFRISQSETGILLVPFWAGGMCLL